MSYRKRHYGAQAFCWEIGIALLPDWRGQGIGWRAQAIFCSYLFENTPVQRIEAATHAENAAEQRSLEKAGFTLEGVIRAAEFRRASGATAPLQPPPHRPRSPRRLDPGPDLFMFLKQGTDCNQRVLLTIINVDRSFRPI